MEDEVIKTWRTEGVYNSFEKADAKRNELKESFDLIKVKRCGPGGSLFKIKTWLKPQAKKPKPLKSKNKTKYTKGKKNAHLRS